MRPLSPTTHLSHCGAKAANKESLLKHSYPHLLIFVYGTPIEISHNPIPPVIKSVKSLLGSQAVQNHVVGWDHVLPITVLNR